MNDKGADQTARMRRLVRNFVVRMQQCQPEEAMLDRTINALLEPLYEYLFTHVKTELI